MFIDIPWEFVPDDMPDVELYLRYVHNPTKRGGDLKW